MLGDFPHEGFADMQFYRMIGQSPPLQIDVLSAGRADPVIRSLSTYYIARPLGYLAEYRLGKGGVILSSLDMDQRWPEARWLLGQILSYAAGPAFKPRHALSAFGRERLLEAGELARHR